MLIRPSLWRGSLSSSKVRGTLLRIPSRTFPSHRAFSNTRVGKATIEIPTSAGKATLEVHTDPAIPKSPLGRFVGASTLVFLFAAAGFTMTALPAFATADEILYPPNDAQTLTLFEPYDAISQEVEDYINNHPLVLKLRADPSYTESRPHLRMPASQRVHSLTGGILMGPGKVVVPPFAWATKGDPEKGILPEVVSISYVGHELCGHPGIIHGGFLATMLDEGLVKACVNALPNHVGMTANLNINYRAPAMAGNYFCLRARTTRVEGRKAWTEGWIETLADETKGETAVKLVEATALAIEPRQAATMAKIMPTSD